MLFQVITLFIRLQYKMTPSRREKERPATRASVATCTKLNGDESTLQAFVKSQG